MTYRTAPGACLACNTPLEPMGRRLRCPSCRSCLVPRADVDDAIRAMGRAGEPGRPLPSIIASNGASRRPCPKCAAAMSPCFLAGVPIDECAAHGLWFDHDEFERVLHSRAPKPAESDVTATDAARGVLDGLGTVIDILNIFT